MVPGKVYIGAYPSVPLKDAVLDSSWAVQWRKDRKAGKRTRRKRKNLNFKFSLVESTALPCGAVDWEEPKKRILKFIARGFPVPFIILSNASLSCFKIFLGRGDCVHLSTILL